jgi:hypothetical protein
MVVMPISMKLHTSVNGRMEFVMEKEPSPIQEVETNTLIS